MAIMETTIDKFGRVLIPKHLRDNLGLTEGTTLSVEASENQVILKPTGVASPLVRKGHILVFTGAREGDLRDAVKTDRKRRAGKFLPRVKAKQS
jgi:AbrB family looped-hinge helix DNA binding protein